MTATHYCPRQMTIRTRGSRRRRPRRLAPLRPSVRSTATPPVQAAPVDDDVLVFQDGGKLSATEIATLRLFAAAGIRPRCVVAGTGRAPNAGSFWAALDISSTRTVSADDPT